MGNALTWTMGRQLATFGDISYTYNESGIRTSKTSNGVTTKFYLDGTNIIEQTDGTTTLYFFYDSTGEVVGFKYNGNNYIYVKNSMGDIVGITDISGNIVTEYSYDPWGKLLSISGNTIIGELNPFRYRSYYYDSDIKMYYLQSRYYAPKIGRFINSDDVDYLGKNETNISYNPFTYCNNNSIVYCDPEGCITINALCLNLYSIIKELLNKDGTLEGYFKKNYSRKKFGEPPIEIKISNNTIKISVTFKFSGSLKNKKFADKSYNKTYKKLFLDGVKLFWQGSFKVFGYDEVKLKINVKESKTSGINVNMIDGFGISNKKGDWKIGNYGVITVYKGDSRDGNFYDSNSFMFVSAHEFGHALGVKDIYGTIYDNIESIFNVFHTAVQDSDVEMVLLAFITGSAIFYEDLLRWKKKL